MKSRNQSLKARKTTRQNETEVMFSNEWLKEIAKEQQDKNYS
jgi:hypothetical protein